MGKTYKEEDTILSVTLRKNHFATEENSFVGRVTRNTVNLENLIAKIIKKNPGVSPYMVEHSAQLLEDEMLETCKAGKAVDVLGLGRMYISVAGSVNGENPGESSIPGFKLNFTPSQKAQEALNLLKVDQVVISDSCPVFDKIINVFDQNHDKILYKDKGVKITGRRLKVMGEDSGIWFVPLDAQGNPSKDESTWTAVESSTISVNKPKSLEFYVPASLTDSQYCIVIRTRFSSGDKELKNAVTAFSKPVTIAA